MKNLIKFYLGLLFQFIGLVFTQIGAKLNPTAKDFYITIISKN